MYIGFYEEKTKRLLASHAPNVSHHPLPHYQQDPAPLPPLSLYCTKKKRKKQKRESLQMILALSLGPLFTHSPTLSLSAHKQSQAFLTLSSSLTPKIHSETLSLTKSLFTLHKKIRSFSRLHHSIFAILQTPTNTHAIPTTIVPQTTVKTPSPLTKPTHNPQKSLRFPPVTPNRPFLFISKPPSPFLNHDSPSSSPPSSSTTFDSSAITPNQKPSFAVNPLFSAATHSIVTTIHLHLLHKPPPSKPFNTSLSIGLLRPNPTKPPPSETLFRLHHLPPSQRHPSPSNPEISPQNPPPPSNRNPHVFLFSLAQINHSRVPSLPSCGDYLFSPLEFCLHSISA